jgi:hypothetical protein
MPKAGPGRTDVDVDSRAVIDEIDPTPAAIYQAA